MDYEMPPVTNSRTYAPTVISNEEVLSFLNRINGLWARIKDGHVEYGLSPIISYQPSADQLFEETVPGAFIANPYGENYLDSAESGIISLDSNV